MKHVFTHLFTYKLAVGVALTLTLIELGVELIQPLLMARIIDHGIIEQDLSTVVFWGSIMIGLSFVSFAAGIINSFYASYASQHTGYDLRSSLFDKVQSFAFSNFSQFPTSSLMTRMTNDVNQLQNTIFMSLRIMLRAPLLVIGSVIMALVVNWQLALILVVTIPVLVAFLLFLMRKAGELFKRVQRSVDQVNSVVQENLTAIRLVKSFTRREYEGERFDGAADELKNRTVKTMRLIEITMPVILLVMNASIMAVLWFGTIGVGTNGASVGEVVAIINYVTRMTGALSIFSMIIMIFSRAKASVERTGEVLDANADILEPEEAVSMKQGDGTITFEGVTFSYPGTRLPVIRDWDKVIPGRSRIAVMGATGSGKTSLFQLIPRLYEADRGSVRIDGQDIRKLSSKELRQRIGYVPQEVMLFTGTISDNLRWGRENATEREMIQALKDAQIWAHIEALPEGLKTRIGQKGVNLSGGQKQRLSIARALLRKPQILLLDDCTSALDARTERNLLDALSDYPCTTLMITQKISSTKRMDEVLLMENGVLHASGTHDELLQSSPLYRKMYESQYGEEVHESWGN
ncbi:ABC transporter ATP-binding protein [Salisediminibacterium selenitireducens]|uniref:ABC transporter related protein n=1 Tax=Bacillus selenitireducens (strain ATCC 700615 / DSM 15326 / MLS10) TaxID=439292 RepID=D6XZ10_BACIE|nr:ABC transporter ATP-binding protein [Salisediminibacterium selenitireducens]ADI00295.1 ABC transporter related protein [[Bacillus] selenitireducens MLS10]